MEKRVTASSATYSTAPSSAAMACENPRTFFGYKDETIAYDDWLLHGSNLHECVAGVTSRHARELRPASQTRPGFVSILSFALMTFKRFCPA